MQEDAVLMTREQYVEMLVDAALASIEPLEQWADALCLAERKAMCEEEE
jgi:hypothetical protein